MIWKEEDISSPCKVKETRVPPTLMNTACNSSQNAEEIETASKVMIQPLLQSICYHSYCTLCLHSLLSPPEQWSAVTGNITHISLFSYPDSPPKEVDYCHLLLLIWFQSIPAMLIFTWCDTIPNIINQKNMIYFSSIRFYNCIIQKIHLFLLWYRHTSL